MKNITNLVLAAFLLSIVAVSPAAAHCGKCGMEGMHDDYAAKKVEKLTEKLDLTEEQAAQVKTLIEEKMEKKKAIKAEKMEKMDELSDEFHSKLNAILTDEQKVKHEAMKAEMKEKGEGHQHGQEKMKMDMEEGSDS